MRLLRYIAEEYVTRFKSSGGSCELFKWPAASEISKDIKSGYVRFLYVDDTFYVFDANKATHFEALMQGDKNYSSMVIWGIGQSKSGKIEIKINDNWACDWGNEFHFNRHSSLKSKVEPALRKCKQYFYNWQEIYDYYKKVSNLTEEYVKSFKISNRDYVEIFKNPDRKEIQQFLGKDIRWAIIKNGLYIWNGDLATHFQVANELGYSYHDISLSGLATVDNGKLKYDTGYDLFYTERDSVMYVILKFKDYFSNYKILLSDLESLLK